jgi:hypothetical protein
VSKILTRVADAGGILFVVCLMVGYVVLIDPFMPDSLDSPDAVLTHLQSHPPTATFWAGVWVESAGLVALVLFGARLAGRIRAAEPGSWLPFAVVGLAVGSFAVKIGSFAPSLAALHIDRYDAGTVTALLDINYAAFYVCWALDGAFAVLVGLAALAIGGLPRWLGAFAVVAGLAVVGGLADETLLENMQLVFLVWMVVTSGWLLTRASRTPAAAQEPAFVS